MRFTGISHSFTIAFISLTLNALAEESSPQIISKKVAEAYKELNTYQSEGKILSQLSQSKLKKSELIEGDDCYVLSGSSDFSLKETYWVSKKTFLIRQYHRSLEAPEGVKPHPKMTDQEVKESLKGMGVKVTPKNIQKMKTIMEESAQNLADVQLKGFTVEFQSNISSPDFKKKDFQFKMPKEARLKDSLFGSIFDDEGAEDDEDGKK